VAHDRCPPTGKTRFGDPLGGDMGMGIPARLEVSEATAAQPLPSCFLLDDLIYSVGGWGFFLFNASPLPRAFSDSPRERYQWNPKKQQQN